jgi:hypothetical protein
MFELAKLLERIRRTLRRLATILPPQLARCAAHLLGDVAHLPAILTAAVLALFGLSLRVLPGLLATAVLTGLPRLTRLSGLACLTCLP